MVRFCCDYDEGAHPLILKKLAETNFLQTAGYEEDEYCDEAAQMICKACGKEDLAVHFLVGGTQTNLTVIAAALRSHQCAICADTGHINVHETGAIEATGHKVFALPSADGKLTAAQVQAAIDEHSGDSAREHMAQPKLVYLSHPTELGTLYTKQELTEISDVCREKELILYVDGARLGYALGAAANDINLPDLAKLCDIFYIGGTKVGALFGEALVIVSQDLREDFRYLIKQRGGMLAKGRLLGIQFGELFRNGLYTTLGAQATALALKIRGVLEEKGYPFLVDSPTNQQFVIFPDEVLDRLSEKYVFSYQKRMDRTHSAVRICTSWATTPEQAEELIRDIRAQ